jgi:acyl transferase domain-containing protein
VQLQEQLSVFVVGKQPTGLVSGQVTSRKQPKIAFLFTGQGSQYVNMGRQLYDTQPTFRTAFERCDEILRSELNKPLLEVLYLDINPESKSLVRDCQRSTQNQKVLDQTAYTQPALFALEYALFQLWKSWGIEPAVVMGHSVGEYVAAVSAGVFSLEDGLKLIAARGRLMQALPQDGEMVAVLADPEQVTAALEPYGQQVSIASQSGHFR